MGKYLAKRIAISAVTLLLIMVILFLLLSLMPGTPFNDNKLSEDQLAVLSAKYGLDRPLPERLFLYIKNMLKGDFGLSYNLAKNVPVTELLRSRMPVSIGIGFFSLLLGSVLGMLLGFAAAYRGGGLLDHLCSLVSVVGISVPSYAFAVLMAYTLGFQLRLTPLIYDMRDPVRSAALPVLASSVMIVSVIARFSRDEARRVMRSDYVLFARSQGIRGATLLVHYVLRNSMLPIATVMASLIVSLLTGGLVLEDIFAVPGIGSFLTTAVANNDYNVILGLSFVYSLIYIVAMLLVDIAYGLLDPRVRLDK